MAVSPCRAPVPWKSAAAMRRKKPRWLQAKLSGTSRVGGGKSPQTGNGCLAACLRSSFPLPAAAISWISSTQTRRTGTHPESSLLKSAIKRFFAIATASHIGITSNSKPPRRRSSVESRRLLRFIMRIGMSDLRNWVLCLAWLRRRRRQLRRPHRRRNRRCHRLIRRTTRPSG